MHKLCEWVINAGTGCGGFSPSLRLEDPSQPRTRPHRPPSWSALVFGNDRHCVSRPQNGVCLQGRHGSRSALFAPCCLFPGVIKKNIANI